MLYRIIHPHIFPETYKMRHCRILKHAYSTGHNLLHKLIVGFHSSPGISNVCRKLGQHLLVARGQLLVVVLKTLYSYQCICPGEYDMDACVCVCVYTHGRGVYCLWQLHAQTSNPSENCPHLGCFFVWKTNNNYRLFKNANSWKARFEFDHFTWVYLWVDQLP